MGLSCLTHTYSFADGSSTEAACSLLAGAGHYVLTEPSGFEIGGRRSSNHKVWFGQPIQLCRKSVVMNVAALHVLPVCCFPPAGSLVLLAFLLHMMSTGRQQHANIAQLC